MLILNNYTTIECVDTSYWFHMIVHSTKTEHCEEGDDQENQNADMEAGDGEDVVGSRSDHEVLHIKGEIHPLAEEHRLDHA